MARRRMLYGGEEEKPIQERYLTFDIEQNGNLGIALDKGLPVSTYAYFEYKVNKGSWVKVNNSDDTNIQKYISVIVGDKVLLRGSGTSCQTSSGTTKMRITGPRFKASGNMSSLCYLDDFSTKTHSSRYRNLFQDSPITDASELYLQSTNAPWYASLFNGASQLKKGPVVRQDGNIVDWQLFGMFTSSGITEVELYVNGTVAGYGLGSFASSCSSLKKVKIYIGGEPAWNSVPSMLQNLTQENGIAYLGGYAWTYRSYYNIPSSWTLIHIDADGNEIT